MIVLNLLKLLLNKVLLIIDTMLILSDEQTKGRGRFNRNWSSSKGKGLWMSVVLRPNVSFAMIPKFNLL